MGYRRLATLAVLIALGIVFFLVLRFHRSHGAIPRIQPADVALLVAGFALGPSEGACWLRPSCACCRRRSILKAAGSAH